MLTVRNINTRTEERVRVEIKKKKTVAYGINSLSAERSRTNFLNFSMSFIMN